MKSLRMARKNLELKDKILRDAFVLGMQHQDDISQAKAIMNGIREVVSTEMLQVHCSVVQVINLVVCCSGNWEVVCNLIAFSVRVVVG